MKSVLKNISSYLLLIPISPFKKAYTLVASRLTALSIE